MVRHIADTSDIFFGSSKISEVGGDQLLRLDRMRLIRSSVFDFPGQETTLYGEFVEFFRL